MSEYEEVGEYNEVEDYNEQNDVGEVEEIEEAEEYNEVEDCKGQEGPAETEEESSLHEEPGAAAMEKSAPASDGAQAKEAGAVADHDLDHIQGLHDDDAGSSRDSASADAAESTEDSSQPQQLQGSSADEPTQQDEIAAGTVPAFGELTLNAAKENASAASQAQGSTDSADVHSSKKASQTQQDKNADDKVADESGYTGSMKERESEGGMFPQPLAGICQRGEQIGAGLDPITHKPDAKRKTWTNNEKQAVWEKASEVPGKDATKIRKDSANREIHWDDYGKREEHGWDVDHIDSLYRGGDNQLSNLQALQWNTNRNVKRHHVQMKHGDKVSFQEVKLPTKEEVDSTAQLNHAVATGTVGKQ